MLIDEIKKANIQAMKDKDTDARSVYSVVINKYVNLEIDLVDNQNALNFKDGDEVKIVGIITSIKKKFTKTQNYKI